MMETTKLEETIHKHCDADFMDYRTKEVWHSVKPVCGMAIIFI